MPYDGKDVNRASSILWSKDSSYRKLQKLGSIKEEKLPKTAFLNRYPQTGCYDYGGSLPLSAWNREETVIVRSSLIHRRYPFASPSRLPMFRKLCQTSYSP
eukprot:gene9329-10294_t